MIQSVQRHKLFPVILSCWRYPNLYCVEFSLAIPVNRFFGESTALNYAYQYGFPYFTVFTMKIYLFLASLGLSMGLAKADDITIFWPKFHWPPFNTEDHDGYFDLQHQHITDKIAGFKHQLLEKIPPNRLVYYVTTDANDAYCYWGMEDSDFFRANSLYSSLVGYAPELQMVMTRQSRQKLVERFGYPIPILGLFQDDQFVPGMERDRPLSDEIRSLTSTMDKANEIKRFVTRADPYQKYNLLLKNRLPVILENFIAFYWVKNNYPEAENLVIEAFAEQTQFFSRYYVVCNQTENSRVFIDALNQAIANTVSTREFIELVKPFYDDIYYKAYLDNSAELPRTSPQK